MKEIKFGYFYRKDYFTIEFENFDKERIKKEDSKFVQLYIKGEPLIIAGNNLYHRDILKLYLEKFNLKFDTRLNISKDIVPLEKGENYEMVGAGRVELVDEEIIFYDNSSDYLAMFPEGTNKKHLEDFFKLNNIKEEKGSHGTTSFFIKNP